MIISLILAMAPVFSIDPNIALAVAKVESNLDPKAIGSRGEVGLFQLMPQVIKQHGFTKKQAADPLNNIYLGLKMLKYAKDQCPHKGGLNSLVCYNVGLGKAKNIKNPSKFIYVKKVTKKLLTILSSSR